MSDDAIRYQPHHRIKGHYYWQGSRKLPQRFAIIAITLLLVLVSNAPNLVNIAILVAGIGLVLPLPWTGRICYEHVLDQLQDVRLRRRDNSLLTTPVMQHRRSQNGFDVSIEIVGVEPAYGQHETEVIPVVTYSGSRNDTIYILFEDARHNALNDDALDRWHWNTKFSFLVDQLFRMGVRDVAFMAAQRPFDNYPTLGRMRQVLDLEFADEVRQRLYDNFSAAHDLDVNLARDVHVLLAVTLPRRDLWGTSKRPRQLTAVQRVQLPLERIMTVVKREAQGLGFKARMLSAVELASLLRSTLNTTMARDSYHLLMQDKMDVTVQRNVDESRLLRLGVAPTEVITHWDAIQCDETFHRFLVLARPPKDNERAAPDFMDAFDYLAPESGYISQTLVARLGPLGLQRFMARATSDILQSRRHGDDRYRPDKDRAVYESHDRVEELSVYAKVACPYTYMVRLSAASMDELDVLSRFVEDEFTTRRMPLQRVRLKSRQRSALLNSIGIAVED